MKFVDGPRFTSSRNRGLSPNIRERETAVVAKPVTGSDQKVDEVEGTQETRIGGDNVSAYRQRVERVHGESD